MSVTDTAQSRGGDETLAVCGGGNFKSMLGGRVGRRRDVPMKMFGLKEQRRPNLHLVELRCENRPQTMVGRHNNH